MRFRRLLVAHGLDAQLFEVITAQLREKAITIKTGTLVEATIIASASKDDDEGRWVKYKGKPAIRGFKAHIGADAGTALVEKIPVTPANVNDGRAGGAVIPDDPGEVFADSACRGTHFSMAVRARGGTPHVVVTGLWGHDEQACRPGTSPSITAAAGSRRSSAPGSAATVSVECDGAVSPKPPPRFTSPPSPAIPNLPSTFSPQPHDCLQRLTACSKQVRKTPALHKPRSARNPHPPAHGSLLY